MSKQSRNLQEGDAVTVVSGKYKGICPLGIITVAQDPQKLKLVVLDGTSGTVFFSSNPKNLLFIASGCQSMIGGKLPPEFLEAIRKIAIKAAEYYKLMVSAGSIGDG